jgi:hypothetical protein
MSDSLRQFIEPDEDIVWFGKPDPFRYAISRSPTWFFSGVLLAALCYWGVSPQLAGGGYRYWFEVASILGMALFIGALLLSPVSCWRQATRLVYLITNRRAMIVDEVKKTPTIQEKLTDIKKVRLSGIRGERKIGNVHFTEESTGDDTMIDAGFVAIPDAKDVDETLRRLLPRT